MQRSARKAAITSISERYSAVASRTADGESREQQSAANTRVREFAGEEAERLGHAAIDTEHLLLGIIRLGDSRAARIVTRLGVDLDSLRAAIVQYVSQNHQGRPASDVVPRTRGNVTVWRDRVKQVFDAAYQAAREDEPPLSPLRPLDVEHMLLGLLRVEEGVAAQILAAWGVTYEAARRELRALRSEEAEEANPG